MPDDTLRAAALDYHRLPTPGKISVVPTKAMATQRDLALAYSPGVAEACLAIAGAPGQAGALRARSKLVAVVTHGRQQGTLRDRDQRTHAGRCDAGGRHLSRPVGRRR